MFVIAFKEEFKETYYTGKKYTYDKWKYPCIDTFEFAKRYKTKGLANRSLKSIKDNCYYGYEMYIKEIK